MDNFADNFWDKNSKSEPTLKRSSGTLWLVFIQKTGSVEIVPKFFPKIGHEIVPKIQKMTWLAIITIKGTFQVQLQGHFQGQFQGYFQGNFFANFERICGQFWDNFRDHFRCNFGDLFSNDFEVNFGDHFRANFEEFNLGQFCGQFLGLKILKVKLH